MDLEARLHALQTELDSAPSSMRQKSLDPATWIPRSPARHNLSGHRMPVTGLAFHPTFTVVASSSEDATIKIWDWETGEFEQTIKGHTKAVHDVDFSFDGKLLSILSSLCTTDCLVSCSSDLTLKLWDSTNSYSTLKTLHGHDHTISSVRFVPPRGDLAVSCSRDRSVKVWDVVSGYCVRTISNAHTDWIRTVSPSDDGAWYLSAGNDQVLPTL
jgi:platelet-activating factor acetylhydrolase IB subunit alpha